MTTVTYAASAASVTWGLLFCAIAVAISAGPVVRWLRQQDGERVARVVLGLALLGLGVIGYAQAATVTFSDIYWGCIWGFFCW